jgi:hypothetical protein
MGKVFNDACMTDDDFRNLEHDVQRHEGDLDRQAKGHPRNLKEDLKTLIRVVEYMWRCPQRGY